MQPFDIVTRDTKAWVRSYMANSREHALEQYFRELGRRDDTVKAKGPPEKQGQQAKRA